MPKTYVTIILDKSGSMQGTRDTVLQGYNEQIQQIKENAKDTEIYASLVTFNGDVFENTWCVEASQLNEATKEDYIPAGSTALRDAIGYTLTKLANTVKDDNDTAYLVTIISDGYENASKHVSQAALSEQIEALQKTGRWTFTYMGCDESYLKKVSKEMNIPISNMAVWSNSNETKTKQAFTSHNYRANRYYQSRARGLVQADCLYSDNIAACADFTKSNNEADPTITLKSTFGTVVNMTDTVDGSGTPPVV